MITDLSYLESMSGKDTNFIREMVEIFREQVEEYTSEMPRLLKAEDYENLSRIAHKAKSSVAVMGMHTEADRLKDLEIKARNGQETDTYQQIIDAFIENSGHALTELDQYLSKS